MTILIKNGFVYDGTGNALRKTDILISEKGILKIGNISRSPGKKIINAKGLYIHPGFIETALHFDNSHIFFSEMRENFIISHGVTSIIGGGFGRSLVPFCSRTISHNIHHGYNASINRNWEQTKDLFYFLEEKRKPKFNFGTLVGFETLHSFFPHHISRDFSQEELKSFLFLLEENLKQGAWGLSIDLSHHTSVGLSKKVLENIMRVLKKHEKILWITLRAKKNFTDAFHEIYDLTKDTKVNTALINFPGSYNPTKEELKNIFEIMEKNSPNVNFHIGIAPWEEKEGFLKDLLPLWIYRDRSHAQILRDLISPVHQKRIIEHFEKTLPDNITLGKMPENFCFLEGKSLSLLARIEKKKIPQMMLSLLCATKMRGEYRFSKKISKQLITDCLSSPHFFIASGDTFFSKQNSFSSIFTFARKYQVSIEKLISQYTLLPAKKFQIKKRGLIKKGYSADLVISDKDGIIQNVFINGISSFSPRFGNSELCSGTIFKNNAKKEKK